MDEKKRKEHGKDEEDIVFDFELFSFALSCPPLSFSFLSSIPLLLLVSEVATWKGKTMKRNRKKEIIRLLPKEDISDGRRKRMRERGTERIREWERRERIVSSGCRGWFLWCYCVCWIERNESLVSFSVGNFFSFPAFFVSSLLVFLPSSSLSLYFCETRKRRIEIVSLKRWHKSINHIGNNPENEGREREETLEPSGLWKLEMREKLFLWERKKGRRSCSCLPLEWRRKPRRKWSGKKEKERMTVNRKKERMTGERKNEEESITVHIPRDPRVSIIIHSPPPATFLLSLSPCSHTGKKVTKWRESWMIFVSLLNWLNPTTWWNWFKEGLLTRDKTLGESEWKRRWVWGRRSRSRQREQI